MISMITIGKFTSTYGNCISLGQSWFQLLFLGKD